MDHTKAVLEIVLGDGFDLFAPAPWRSDPRWRDENGAPVPGPLTWPALFAAFSAYAAPYLEADPAIVEEFVKRLPQSELWCFEFIVFWPLAVEAVAEVMGLTPDPRARISLPTIH